MDFSVHMFYLSQAERWWLLRWGFTMLLKPVLNSRDPPPSGSQVLELQACVTRPGSLNFLDEYGVWECISSAGWFESSERRESQLRKHLQKIWL